MTRPFTPVRSGFSLIESVIAISLVGTMMVAALNVVGASQVARQTSVHKSTGLMLAEELMAEILKTPYRDPENGTTHFGVEPDELADTTRNVFDDVDDFGGWTASPPEETDGSKRPNLDQWKRSVIVQRVKHDVLHQTTNSESGVKWITVIVERDGREICRLYAHRADIDP